MNMHLTLSSGDIADELGHIQAQLADLKVIEKNLKDQLIRRGQHAIEGRYFRAIVSHVDATSSIDWRAAFEALVPKTRADLAGDYRRDRAAYTCVSVKARTGQ